MMSCKQMRLTYVTLSLLRDMLINNIKMEPRLSFEQQKAILKWYWRTGNVVEVQRQWRRDYRTEPPTRLTIARIRDKFETHGPYAMFTTADLGDFAHKQAPRPWLRFWKVLNTYRRNLQSNEHVRLGLTEPVHVVLLKQQS